MLHKPINMKMRHREHQLFITFASHLPFHKNLCRSSPVPYLKMSWTPYAVALLVLVLYLLRNRYSGGLNRFDGPFLASVTNLWKIWNVCWFNMPSNRNDHYVNLHRTYGDVVRIGPRNLSFADPRAVPEIYGTKGSQIKVRHLLRYLRLTVIFCVFSW